MEAEEVDIVRVSCVRLRKEDMEKWWWFEIKRWNIRLLYTVFNVQYNTSVEEYEVNPREMEDRGVAPDIVRATAIHVQLSRSS